MTKTHIIETIEEYDTNGKITRKTVTETTEENNDPAPSYTPQWWTPGTPSYPTYADKITYCDNDSARTTTTTNHCEHSNDTVCSCDCCEC